jgi:hypothetical protein
VIVVLLAVLVLVGAFAHLLYTGTAASGTRAMIHELRSPSSRSAQPRIRARDMDAAPRASVYAMYVVWIALCALVAALAIIHWA